MRRNGLMSLLGLISLTVFTGGCASEFDKQWKIAGDQPREINDLRGRWDGKWATDGSRHSGALKAVVVRGDDDTYKALFHATYALVFHFDYTFALTGHPSGGVLNFAGTEDIGAGEGAYSYDGNVTSTRFHCNFKTKDDHGTFDLTRPDTSPTSRVAEVRGNAE